MKKILIVEDESIVALELKDRLEKLGYQVIATVSTGEQAIKTTEEKNPDLILMDIHLKGNMDGITAAKHIKNTPIIYLTAYADTETLNRARITTPYAYIVKPFEERELQSNIEIALYKHQTEQQLQITKDHLENIVEHISEIIFTMNHENKITTWNNSAEQITGYPKKEVLGKTITELSVFPNPKHVHQLLKEKQTNPIRIHVQTAANEQKIIQINQITPLRNDQRTTLLIGTDITKEIQKLKTFHPGNTYLLQEDNQYITVSTLIDYFSSIQKHVLLITLKNTQAQYQLTSNDHLHITYATKQSNKTIKNTIPETKNLIQHVITYNQKHHPAIIILTTIDYYIIQQGFTEFMKTMYQLTDLINDTGNILFITLNPDILTRQQHALLQQVVTTLPKDHINTLMITEGLHNVLEFIQQQKNKGSLVTLKKIKQQLNLSYPTIKKRLSELEGKGLIILKKQGRSKTVHISQKGEQLLKK